MIEPLPPDALQVIHPVCCTAIEVLRAIVPRSGARAVNLQVLQLEGICHTCGRLVYVQVPIVWAPRALGRPTRLGWQS